MSLKVNKKGEMDNTPLNPESAKKAIKILNDMMITAQDELDDEGMFYRYLISFFYYLVAFLVNASSFSNIFTQQLCVASSSARKTVNS